MSDTEPVSEPIDEPVTTNDVESEDDWDLTPAEEPSTATVPEPVAATPPVVPTADVVAHDIPPASPEPVAEVVAEPVVAESKTEAPSVAPVMSRPTVAPTASGTCPLVCSPGLEKCSSPIPPSCPPPPLPLPLHVFVFGGAWILQSTCSFWFCL